MPFAYIMINTELGFVEQVMNELEMLPQVKESYIVYGIYDVITKVEFSDRVELSRIILRKIRGLKGIRSTMTLLIL